MNIVVSGIKGYNFDKFITVIHMLFKTTSILFKDKFYFHSFVTIKYKVLSVYIEKKTERTSYIVGCYLQPTQYPEGRPTSLLKTKLLHARYSSAVADHPLVRWPPTFCIHAVTYLQCSWLQLTYWKLALNLAT